MQPKTVMEKELKPTSGFPMLIILIGGLLLSTAALVMGIARVDSSSGRFGGLLICASLLGEAVCSLLLAGLKTVHPNEARILILFGSYHGTIKNAGFYYVNPFSVSFNPLRSLPRPNPRMKARQTDDSANELANRSAPTQSISLKTQTLDNGLQKVNDVLGNPIIIGAVVIWRIENPTLAVFSVENYFEYLSTQTDSTIRNTARLYPYDVFAEDEDDDGIHEQTLRGSALQIADTMKTELQKRVLDAGLVIEEVRITHLAYAEEIAAAMLQRQQAVAIIAARKKIVDGAVGMVKDAIDKLSENDIVVLDDERKAAMVSNLLVVLVGNHDAQPIVNTGSIY